MARVARAKPHLRPNIRLARVSDAYLNGLCRDGCGNPHSPGRTRCDECHRTWQTAADGYDR